ncbi:hypothetical protein EYZ11_005934 [Aspergillus tanneri]|nr:hypothetical protein EYZ11_005934 [Aspergillus tanneri]
MPTDSPTAKFLYTIIKQLDLKSIDWNLVASQLDISNGHAARMRYSRFRQQMEGITSTPRAPRPKKTANKSKDSSWKMDTHKDTEPTASQPKPEVKQEPRIAPYSSDPYIKADPSMQRIPTLAEIPHFSSPMMIPNQPRPPSSAFPYSSSTVAPVELSKYSPAQSFPGRSPLEYENCPASQPAWSPIKTEPRDQMGVGDVLFKVEQPEEQVVAAQGNEVEYQGTNVAGVDGKGVENRD